MTTATLYWLGGLLIVVLVIMSPAAGQPISDKPAAGKPMTFGEGVRARDRLSPTPQFAPLAPGLYARQIVQAVSGSGDYTVEVWSLLVRPKASTVDVTLSGAAVVTLFAGRVELITGDQRTRLEPGGTATVPQGASVRFVNGDEARPAQLRAVVIVGTP